MFLRIVPPCGVRVGTLSWIVKECGGITMGKHCPWGIRVEAILMLSQS